MFICEDIYVINLLWTPTLNQFGPQGFCAGAVDSTNVQSVPWCITFLVGFTAPNLQPPILVQGSASPIGTIFANHSIFSIQSNASFGQKQKRSTSFSSYSRYEQCWCQPSWKKRNLHPIY